jgi:hypothetical protein
MEKNGDTYKEAVSQGRAQKGQCNCVPSLFGVGEVSEASDTAIRQVRSSGWSF